MYSFHSRTDPRPLDNSADRGKSIIEAWVTNGQIIENVDNRHINEMVSGKPCPSILQLNTTMKSGWNASFSSLAL